MWLVDKLKSQYIFTFKEYLLNISGQNCQSVLSLMRALMYPIIKQYGTFIMEYNIYEELAIICKNSVVQEIHSTNPYIELNFTKQDEEQQSFFNLNDKMFSNGTVIDAKIANPTFPYADYFSLEKFNNKTNYRFQISLYFSQWNKSIPLKDFVLNFVANASKLETSLEIIYTEELGYYLELNSSDFNASSIGERIEKISRALSNVFQETLNA